MLHSVECFHYGYMMSVKPVRGVVEQASLMDARCKILLSSHSTIALSRCSSLRGTVLSCLLPRYRHALGEAVISAAQRATKPDHSAAHAKSAGESMQISA